MPMNSGTYLVAILAAIAFSPLLLLGLVIVAMSREFTTRNELDRRLVMGEIDPEDPRLFPEV